MLSLSKHLKGHLSGSFDRLSITDYYTKVVFLAQAGILKRLHYDYS